MKELSVGTKLRSKETNYDGCYDIDTIVCSYFDEGLNCFVYDLASGVDIYSTEIEDEFDIL